MTPDPATTQAVPTPTPPAGYEDVVVDFMTRALGLRWDTLDTWGCPVSDDVQTALMRAAERCPQVLAHMAAATPPPPDDPMPDITHLFPADLTPGCAVTPAVGWSSIPDRIVVSKRTRNDDSVEVRFRPLPGCPTSVVYAADAHVPVRTHTIPRPDRLDVGTVELDTTFHAPGPPRHR